MKKSEVKVGGTFLAKVSDKVVPVRITGESRYGGWDAVNTKTGKAVRIKSAQRLRGAAALSKAEVQAAKAAVGAQVGAGAKPAAETAKDTRAAPAAAGGGPTNPLEAHYRAQKDAIKKAKAAKPRKERKPGCLDAAVQVLKTAGGGPLGCKEMVERMLAKGLWQTKGKTPAATLYAAVIREIAAKGKDARFHKTSRGQFELSAAARR